MHAHITHGEVREARTARQPPAQQEGQLMSVEINGGTFESNYVECLGCENKVDAQLVLLEGTCPECQAKVSEFFAAADGSDGVDSESVEIDYPIDGPGQVVSS